MLIGAGLARRGLLDLEGKSTASVLLRRPGAAVLTCGAVGLFLLTARR